METPSPKSSVSYHLGRQYIPRRRTDSNSRGPATGSYLIRQKSGDVANYGRLITKALLEGMGAESSVPTSVPWTWATNKPKVVNTSVKVMTSTGLRQGFMNMTVADVGKSLCCDEAWKDVQ